MAEAEGIADAANADYADMLRSERLTVAHAYRAQTSSNELDISLDRGALARYSVNVNDVATTVATALGGAVVDNCYEGDRIF